MTRNELESAIKAATAPNHDLDRAVAVFYGVTWSADDYPGLPDVPPHALFTGSLEAAMSLLKPEWWYVIAKGRTRPDEPIYGAHVLLPDAEPPYCCDTIGEAQHPVNDAMALVLAILQARKPEGAQS